MTSVTSSAINVIIQNPDTINWIKDLLLPIVGVIIGGFITLWATSRANRKMIQYQQENNTLNDIIKVIDKFIESLYDLSFDKTFNSNETMILHSELSIYFAQYYLFFPKKFKKLFDIIDKDSNELFDIFFQYNDKYSALIEGKDEHSINTIFNNDEYKEMSKTFSDKKKILIEDLVGLKIHINTYIFKHELLIII